MRNRSLGVVAVVVALLPALAAAQSAPHDASLTDGNCSSCHTLYMSSAVGQDYNAACLSCHANRPGSFGFPWLSSDQAGQGKGGNQHSWSGYADNATAGAKRPATSLSRHLMSGRLQCVTCHNPHQAGPTLAPKRMHTSIPQNTAVDESGGPSEGTAKLTLTVAAQANPAGYRLRIQSVDAGGGAFIMSHAYGLATPTWLNWNGSAWIEGPVDGPGHPFTNGVAVALDDPKVSVKWTAGAAVGNYWDFYVSYPFLRMSVNADQICFQCHGEMRMTHVRVRGDDPGYRPDGVRRFSHPVGQKLNANLLGTDRAAPLSAVGVAQVDGGVSSTSDLKLDNGFVRCTTCHAVHNADSNSLTEDPR